MSLPTTYTQAYGVLKEFFDRIRDAQAPDKFTHQILKDLGFKSNNHRPFIPILKALGFLSAEGIPTQRYKEYRNHSKSKQIMGEAIKGAYSDIFLIKAHPKPADRDLIQGKFKSYHNASDNVAKLHANTFYSLLNLADIKAESTPKIVEEQKEETIAEKLPTTKPLSEFKLGLHYNIQIHLPATKDVGVYNAIFKSLKDHLIE